jgi:anti-anti-sigma factor
VGSSADPVLEISLLEEATGVAFIGTIDLSTEPDARAAVEPLLQPGASITVDLRKVVFMDSTGLNLLIRALDVIGDEGRLTLRVSSGIVWKVLDVAGLTERPNVVLLPD